MCQSAGFIRQKATISSLLSNGSPPPKVTPPFVALKYRSSIITSSSICCASICCHTPSGLRHCSFKQYLQRNGHPWNATSVVTPCPSVDSRWRQIPISGVFIAFRKLESDGDGILNSGGFTITHAWFPLRHRLDYTNSFLIK